MRPYSRTASFPKLTSKMSSWVFVLALVLCHFCGLSSTLQMKSANRPEAARGLTSSVGRATSLDLKVDESNIPKSRRKRSIIFPTGSDLSFDVGLSIPISALSATSNKGLLFAFFGPVWPFIKHPIKPALYQTRVSWLIPDTEGF